jgi:hypothetical protein
LSILFLLRVEGTMPPAKGRGASSWRPPWP